MDKVLTITINQVLNFHLPHESKNRWNLIILGCITSLNKAKPSPKQNKRFQKACSPCSLKISNSILTWMLFSRIVNRRNKQLEIIDDSTHIQLWNSIATMFSLFEGCFIIWFMFTFFKGYIVASLLPLFVDGLHGETLNTPHYNWTIMHHNWTQIDKSITKFKPKEK